MSYSSNLFYGAPAATLQKAKELRKSMTLAERMLWAVLQNRQLDGYKFRRQHPIYKYIADFYCHELSLVIELDGGVHDGLEQKEHDINRDQVIQEFGIRVLRIKNEEVMDDVEEVISKIKGFLL